MKTVVIADEYTTLGKVSYPHYHDEVTHWSFMYGILKLYHDNNLVALYPKGDWHGVYVEA